VPAMADLPFIDGAVYGHVTVHGCRVRPAQSALPKYLHTASALFTPSS
jgi:hypothetical protein